MNLTEMFEDDAIDKQLNIDVGDAVYTNAELGCEEMELVERMCTQDSLRFGCCEASSLKLRILDTILPLKNRQISVSMTLQEETFKLGKYKVYSDKPTADRRYRDIVAYDAMRDIINAEVSAWYNTILPSADSQVTLKQFRDSFLAHFGVEQEAVALPNDAMIVTRTVEPSKLSGKTVITAICEINGCFGHIGRDGKFQYIFLQEMIEGLYPSDTLYPADDLFPADPSNVEQISKSHYISATYEDYTTAKINKLQIRQEEDDIGVIYGTGDNCYIVQDNFLVYGKSSEELNIIAANLYAVICKVWYRPAHVEAKGNPCLEVGDGIKLHTTYEIIYTYILQRTLRGIQALRDNYEAEGEQYQSEKVNSVHESIVQLKGKTNKLNRSIEETKSELADVEQGLSTQIAQTAQQITLEAQRASEAEGTLSAQISVNAQQILTKVSKNNVISEINQTAEAIKIQAQRIDLVGLVNANEFVSKYATIDTLNAKTAELQSLIATKASINSLNATNVKVDGKLDASEFTADNISAMNITVKGANVTGKLSASKISAGVVNGYLVDWVTFYYLLGVYPEYTELEINGKKIKVVKDISTLKTSNMMLGVSAQEGEQ